MSCTISGDRPSDGSSSSSSRGRAISARAIATICCWPPDSVPAGRVELRPQRREQRERRAPATRARRACAPRQEAAELEVLEHASCREQRRPSGTIAMPCGAEAVRRQARDVAAVELDGARARTGCSPAMALISVDLPALLGPTTHSSSPAPHVQRHVPQRGRGAVGDLERQRASSMRRSQIGGHHVGPRITSRGRRLRRAPGHGSSTTRRSVSASTARITCSTKTIVVPSSRMRRISATASSISPGVRPRQHLVEQHQPRPRRERAREFEELALVQVQLVGQRVGLVARGRRSRATASASRVRCDGDQRGAAEHRRQRHVVAARSGARTGAGSGRCARCRRARCGAPPGARSRALRTRMRPRAGR